MKHTVSIKSLEAREYLVIKGIVKLYDSEDLSILSEEKERWEVIKQQLDDGSVELLKKAASSETVYILFCNTCVRNDAEKCYDCSCDIACENLGGAKAVDGFEIVKLLPCEYAVFDCDFIDESAMSKAHETPDALYWGEWLKDNSYVSAIDDPANWIGNGYASIEQYTPFKPDASKFNVKMWYPIIKKTNSK